VADPANFSGFGSGDAIQAAADAMASAAESMASMADSSAQISSNMKAASSAASSGGGGGGGWKVGGTGSQGTGYNSAKVDTAFGTYGAVGGVATMAMEVGKIALTTIKDSAVSSYNDLRVGRGEALEFERQRARARTGTGEFTRFQDNLNLGMNDINVQNRHQFTADLASAYGSYYSQGFGGGIQGEQRTALAVGGMHTLAAISGVAPEDVGGATNALYDPSTYYRAMAAGVMTRNPVTGDMLAPEEIINQYRNRLKNNTPEEIKRALGPGGILRAELNQTYGDSALVDMVAKGLVMSAEAGKPLEIGDIQSRAMEQGYAGTEWTQGKDSEAKKQAARQSQVAEYTNDVTAGIATSNEILADIYAKIEDLGGFFRKAFGAGETLGGIMDTFNTDMPETTAMLSEKIGGALSEIVSAITSGNPWGAVGGVAQLGTILAGAMIIRGVTAGQSNVEPERTGEYPGIDLPSYVPLPGPAGAIVPPLYNPNPSLPLTDQQREEAYGSPAHAAVMPYSEVSTSRAAVTPMQNQDGMMRAAVMPQRSNEPTMNILPWDGEISWDGSWSDYDTGGTVVDDSQRIVLDDPSSSTKGEPSTEEQRREAMRRKTGGTGTVNLYVTVQRATDAEAIRLAKKVKMLLDSDSELVSAGDGKF
jgi:hypothetical protein